MRQSRTPSGPIGKKNQQFTGLEIENGRVFTGIIAVGEIVK